MVYMYIIVGGAVASTGSRLSPGQGHCVMPLSLLYYDIACFHPGVEMGMGEFNAGVTL